MTRLLALPGLLLLALASVPAPAQANPCHIDDVPCVASCLLDDPCGIYQLDPQLYPCDAGKTGTRVDTGSRTTNACVAVPTATVESCDQGEFGFILYVNGNPTDLCLA